MIPNTVRPFRILYNYLTFFIWNFPVSDYIFAPAYLPVGKFFKHLLSRKAEGNGPMKP